MAYLIKGGVIGVIAGLLLGGLLYLVLINAYPNYAYQSEDFSQMFHGATATGVVLLGLFLFFGDPKRSLEDVRALELLIIIPSGAVLGIFGPLLFWGPISFVSPEILNSVADAIGGFVAGAISAGFFVGLIVAHHREG